MLFVEFDSRRITGRVASYFLHFPRICCFLYVFLLCFCIPGNFFQGLFTVHDPTRGSGQGGFKISWVGSGEEVSKPRGPGRVGSIVFKISRVGWGRIKRFQNLASRDRVMTREIRVTRGSSHHDPRVVFGSPAGRTRGSGLRIRLFQTFIAACRRVLAMPAPRGSDPRIRPAGPKLMQNLPLPACKSLSSRYSDRMLSFPKHQPDSNFSYQA